MEATNWVKSHALSRGFIVTKLLPFTINLSPPLIFTSLNLYLSVPTFITFITLLQLLYYYHSKLHPKRLEPSDYTTNTY